MATTRIMPLHIGKRRTESRANSDIIDYVANPQKTDNGKLITTCASGSARSRRISIIRTCGAKSALCRSKTAESPRSATRNRLQIAARPRASRRSCTRSKSRTRRSLCGACTARRASATSARSSARRKTGHA